MTARGYIEISPLLEPHWTGIPAVTAAIANQAMADDSIDWRFFYGSIDVPREFMVELLASRNGSNARAYLLHHVWGKHDIDFDEGAQGKAIFTTIKTSHRLFASEGLLVYDLSPLLTPQFHTSDNVNHFSNRFRRDIETSDHFFCISKATRDDVTHYFGIPQTSTSVVPMGVDIDMADVSLAQELARESRIEPYVVVLGTLEPRKNGKLVLQYLAKDPGFAHRYRVVFIGREGWLDERAQLMGNIQAAGVRPDRVVFTGFVSEAEKIALLQNCAFCIYASYFEGYGLPILEAAVLGKLVVCSGSSSMPEVAPESCFFFDPSSISEFAKAIALAEKRAPQTRVTSTLLDVTARLGRWTWKPCYEAIAAWVRA